MTIKLSQQTASVFDYIIHFMTAHNGKPPTLEEIRDGMGLASKSTVFYHLQPLEKAGLIVREPNTPRGISVPHSRWEYRPPVDEWAREFRSQS